jgi:hypothetical protein
MRAGLHRLLLVGGISQFERWYLVDCSPQSLVIEDSLVSLPGTPPQSRPPRSHLLTAARLLNVGIDPMSRRSMPPQSSHSVALKSDTCLQSHA